MTAKPTELQNLNNLRPARLNGEAALRSVVFEGVLVTVLRFRGI